MTTPNPKDLVKTSYDSIAPAYFNFITKLPSPKLLWVDKLLDNLTSTSNVLELGCGNGMSGTLPLAEKVRRVVANDISTAQIEIAKGKLAGRGNVEFLEGDMTGLQFEEGSFDAIMALHSIFHLPREEQPVMLGLVYNSLGAEGSKQMLGDAGFEILEAEVVRTVDEKKTVPFLWVLARKP